MCKFIGLKYCNNSCYIDSVLLSLFAIPNFFINQQILNKHIHDKNLKIFQKELIKISYHMRNSQIYSSKNLRKISKFFSNNFNNYEMQDASEFLLFILNLFDINSIKKEIFLFISRSQNKNPILSRHYIEKNSPFVLIPFNKIYDNIDISSFILNIDDVKLYDPFIRKIEFSEIIDSSFLIFNVQRTLLSEDRHEKRTFKKIIPNKKIMINKKILELYSIIIHNNYHYTSYIKCNGNDWFYYDDLSIKPIFIGNYHNLFSQKLDPSRFGTLYFYKSTH